MSPLHNHTRLSSLKRVMVVKSSSSNTSCVQLSCAFTSLSATAQGLYGRSVPLPSKILNFDQIYIEKYWWLLCVISIITLILNYTIFIISIIGDLKILCQTLFNLQESCSEEAWLAGFQNLSNRRTGMPWFWLLIGLLPKLANLSHSACQIHGKIFT